MSKQPYRAFPTVDPKKARKMKYPLPAFAIEQSGMLVENMLSVFAVSTY
jgi:hypothetical protein